jgi:hypothetical protein
VSYRIGICVGCNTRVDLTTRRGERVARFHMERNRPCRGANQPAMLTDEQKLKEMKARRTLERLLSPFRTHAAVALDAWIEQRGYPESDMDVLCRAACYHYQFHYPGSRIVRTVRFEPRINVSGIAMNSGDIYCAFCGVLLIRQVGVRVDRYERSSYIRAASKTNRHAVECALKHLAFSLKPEPPHVRRLPDEYTQPVQPPTDDKGER